MKTILLESEKIAPSKIVCIGRNYLEHIQELGNETPDDMVIFNKPNSKDFRPQNTFESIFGYIFVNIVIVNTIQFNQLGYTVFG